MPYRFHVGRDITAELRRIAAEQIERSEQQITDPELEASEKIHLVRKRGKKLRGLIRLVRPAFKDYAKENRAFRDIGRLLADFRDAEVMVKTVESLKEHFGDEAPAGLFQPYLAEFTARRDALYEDAAEITERQEKALIELERAKERAGSWSLDASDFAALEGGLKKTFKRGRDAMARAKDDPSGKKLHEWRKRAKYHWYHARLLRDVWPELMKPWIAAFDELGDLLGDEHDLAVLRQELKSQRNKEHKALLKLVRQRRSELQGAAFVLGDRLYAEKPGQISRRFGGYWAVAANQAVSESPAERIA